MHPALTDGRHRRRTRAGAAGLGFSGAAFPHSQLRAVTVDHVQKAHVDPGREARVMFNFRAQLMNRRRVDVVDTQHCMRVAHRYGGQLDSLAIDVDFIAQRLFIRHKRNFGRHQTRRAHVNADLTVAAHVQLNDAAFGFDFDLALGGQALVEHKAGKTAGSVAALFNLGPVGVEDPVTEIHLGIARCFNDQ